MKNILISSIALVLCLSYYNTQAQEPVYKQEQEAAERKEKIAEQLVTKAVRRFTQSKVPISKLCAEFMHNKRWIVGELSIFVYDSQGTCYVQEGEPLWIWRNVSHVKTISNVPIIDAMLALGTQGGWLSFRWNNNIKHAYVKTVVKRGKTYIIGSGFYPASAANNVGQIIGNVQPFLNDRGLTETIANINNPFGMFVKGNISVRLIDFEGNDIADGEIRARVGQNVINEQDENGKFIIREAIKIAQSPTGKGWTECICAHELQRIYVERVVDLKTKRAYVAMAGFYPHIDDQAVINFVKRAITSIQSNGIDEAYREFSSSVGDFVKGDLRVYVYRPDGTVVYDGYNPGTSGQNIIDLTDPFGKPITRKILDQAERLGRGWVSYYFRNYYFYSYLEKIEVPDGIFIVGSGYWSWAKAPATRSLVEEAVEYLKTRTLGQAMYDFTADNSDFLRGDLYIQVLGSDGFVWAQTHQRRFIWQDFKTLKDDKGRSIFGQLSAMAAGGGGWVEYEQNNATRRAYVRQVEKPIENSSETGNFIISSGYYL